MNRPVRSSENREYPVEFHSLPGIFVIFVFILFLQASVAGLSRISSPSMEDTLLVGDTVLVLKTWYGFRPPFSGNTVTKGHPVRPNDVVVFDYPFDPKEQYIKRCAAVGGQTVSIRKKQLFVNGKPVIPLRTVRFGDPEIFPEAQSRRDFLPPKNVPEDSIFVLGDNRDFSGDSRVWGCVPERNLRGKASYIIWSIDPDISWKDFSGKIRWARFFRRIE